MKYTIWEGIICLGDGKVLLEMPC